MTALGAATGRVMVKTAPARSSRLPATTVPPIASTKPRQMARPSPVPARCRSARRKRDRRAGRGVFPGIVEQIEKDLFEQNEIDAHHRQIGFEVDGYAMVLEDPGGPLQRGADDL